MAGSDGVQLGNRLDLGSYPARPSAPATNPMHWAQREALWRREVEQRLECLEAMLRCMQGDCEDD